MIYPEKKLASTGIFYKEDNKVSNNIEENIINRKGPVSYERAFVTVTKRLLKEETYRMLLEEAKFLVEDAEEKFHAEKRRQQAPPGKLRPGKRSRGKTHSVSH